MKAEGREMLSVLQLIGVGFQIQVLDRTHDVVIVAVKSTETQLAGKLRKLTEMMCGL
jgi:hypothetical protein